jgi:hypothetical protein
MLVGYVYKCAFNLGLIGLCMEGGSMGKFLLTS